MHGSDDKDFFFSDLSSDFFRVFRGLGLRSWAGRIKGAEGPSQFQSRSLALSNAISISIANPATVPLLSSAKMRFSHIVPQYRHCIPDSGPARLIPPFSIRLQFYKREPTIVSSSGNGPVDEANSRSRGLAKIWRSVNTLPFDVRVDTITLVSLHRYQT